MLFNSQAFIIGFLPAVLALYYALAANRSARQSLLILASMGFYGWWDARFVPLLAGLTVANWLIAVWFGRARQKWIPVLGVVLNLAVLSLFKYVDFLRGTVFDLAGEPWQPWHLILPLGISFFVFQKISYLVDLRRGEQHIYGFLDFSLFVMFFPQLIAGPLVRHNEIIHQFRADPRGGTMWENLGRGFVLFVIGVAKKVALADSLAMIADPLFARATDLGLGEAWTAALAFMLQIYFDFSGYSDMAIGLALMFGLRLPFNFDAPYRATSVRDFWRAWHMTLSRFLRDYLYIPLGGNRSGPMRQAANLVLTMLLGGLWHGANWTFVVWGGLQGVAMAVNLFWSYTGVNLPRWFAWALTMLFILLAFVLFHSPNFAVAGNVWGGMAGLNGFAVPSLNNEAAAALIAGCAIAVVGPTSQRFALELLRPVPWVAVPAGVLLSWLLLLIGGRLPNVFIYFQF
jgi:alginate O-acetyltransferase complex protein AlgI